jgi:GH25 family lysozyme M1 (1,4-beta-N-acetylmuramidase)
MTLKPMEYKIKHPMAIDLSLWERDVRWEELDPKPLIMITKASEYKWKDPMAVKHYQNAKAQGIKVGLYHFFRVNDVSSQVNTFLEVARECGAWDGKNWLADVAPVLDAEYSPPVPTKTRGGGTVTSIRGNALAGQYKAWLDMVEQITKVKPIIYTNQSYWSYTRSGFPISKVPTWTSDYKLWLAWYPYEPDKFDTVPDKVFPEGFKKENLIMWQYSEAGVLKGIPYDGVDLNLISESYYKEMFGSDVPDRPNEDVEYSLGELLEERATYLNDAPLKDLVYKIKEKFNSLWDK